mmetsp:Transcript_72394/g.204623  ORF Transcript_72394/g.204623 Transcript_72394/m.204623 type:complete len:307 (+) Transcript_72394:343-1263(+)
MSSSTVASAQASNSVSTIVRGDEKVAWSGVVLAQDISDAYMDRRDFWVGVVQPSLPSEESASKAVLSNSVLEMPSPASSAGLSFQSSALKGDNKVSALPSESPRDCKKGDTMATFPSDQGMLEQTVEGENLRTEDAAEERGGRRSSAAEGDGRCTGAGNEAAGPSSRSMLGVGELRLGRFSLWQRQWHWQPSSSPPLLPLWPPGGAAAGSAPSHGAVAVHGPGMPRGMPRPPKLLPLPGGVSPDAGSAAPQLVLLLLPASSGATVSSSSGRAVSSSPSSASSALSHRLTASSCQSAQAPDPSSTPQ